MLVTDDRAKGCSLCHHYETFRGVNLFYGTWKSWWRSCYISAMSSGKKIIYTTRRNDLYLNGRSPGNPPYVVFLKAFCL